jgi:hypothetical protein
MDIIANIEAIEEILAYSFPRSHQAQHSKRKRDANSRPAAVKIEPIENPGFFFDVRQSKWNVMFEKEK